MSKFCCMLTVRLVLESTILACCRYMLTEFLVDDSQLYPIVFLLQPTISDRVPALLQDLYHGRSSI